MCVYIYIYIYAYICTIEFKITEVCSLSATELK